jgi:hypothetical protein
VYRGSSRQSLLIVEQITVVDGSERFSKVCRAIVADLNKPFSQTSFANAPHPLQTFPDRPSNCHRYAFAGQRHRLSRKPMRFLILDIETHCRHSTMDSTRS